MSTCEKHKKYKGMRKPKCACTNCWIMYHEKKNGKPVEVGDLLPILKDIAETLEAMQEHERRNREEEYFF